VLHSAFQYILPLILLQLELEVEAKWVDMKKTIFPINTNYWLGMTSSNGQNNFVWEESGVAVNGPGEPDSHWADNHPDPNGLQVMKGNNPVHFSLINIGYYIG
jgi:hypothetical protein